MPAPGKAIRIRPSVLSMDPDDAEVTAVVATTPMTMPPDWFAEFRSLEGPAAVAYLENRAMRLLATGRLVELRAAVAAVTFPSRTAMLQVADLEAAVRLGQAHLSDVDAAHQNLARAPGENSRDFGPWLTALRAEYLLWHCDLASVEEALKALAAMPDSALATTEIMVPRARLHRILALACLLGGDDAGARNHLSAACRGFARSRWDDERDLTVVVYSLLRSCIHVDGLEVSLAVIGHASRNLADRESPHHVLALVARAMVAFLQGDMADVRSALDDLDESPFSDAPLAALPARYLRILARIIGSGCRDAAALAEIESTCAEFRSRFPEGSGMFDAIVGNVLADFGLVAMASSWTERALCTGDAAAATSIDFRFLRARLVLETGNGPSAATSTWALLAEMEDRGMQRDAGTKALRFAHDCARNGRTDDAAAFQVWGLARLPDGVERTVWEHIWARPIGMEQARVPASPVEVRLLGARATVVRDGVPRPLKGMTAKLLAVLVAADGRASTEQLIDRLWPEADVETGRNRLNVTFFRLRRMLGVTSADVLRREGDLVEFDPPPVWRVDTVAFTAWAAGSTDDKLAALALYRDHLCAQQLAYDDAVAPMRAWLRARLVDLMCDLVEDPSVDPAPIAQKALDLGVLDTKLSERLVAALENAGHSALAGHVSDAAM